MKKVWIIWWVFICLGLSVSLVGSGLCLRGWITSRPIEAWDTTAGVINIEPSGDDLVITMGDPNDFCKECPRPQGDEIVICPHAGYDSRGRKPFGIITEDHVIDGLLLEIVDDAGIDWLKTTGDIVDQLDRIEETINAVAKCLLAMGEAQLISSRKINEMHAVICEPAQDFSAWSTYGIIDFVVPDSFDPNDFDFTTDTLEAVSIEHDCGLIAPTFYDGYDNPNVCKVDGLCTKHAYEKAIAPCRDSQRERIRK